MNNSGRMKLYMSIGLAVLLVVQIIIFFFLKPGTLGGVAIIFGIIILMAVIAVYFNYNSVKQAEKRVEYLPEDYRTFYIDATEAINLSSMKRRYKRDTRHMILEILEHASADGRSLEEVVGNDRDSYISAFITASGGSLTPLYLFGYSLASFVLYLLFMKAYKVFRDGGNPLDNLATETLDVGIVLTYALIGFIFLPWLLIVMQKAAKNQWSGLKRLLIILPLSIPLGLMMMLIFVDSPALRTFLDQPLPLLSNPWQLLLGILVGVLSLVIISYARKRQLRRALD